jgi:hypothetical protein
MRRRRAAATPLAPPSDEGTGGGRGGGLPCSPWICRAGAGGPATVLEPAAPPLLKAAGEEDLRASMAGSSICTWIRRGPRALRLQARGDGRPCEEAASSGARCGASSLLRPVTAAAPVFPPLGARRRLAPAWIHGWELDLRRLAPARIHGGGELGREGRREFPAPPPRRHRPCRSVDRGSRAAAASAPVRRSRREGRGRSPAAWSPAAGVGKGRSPWIRPPVDAAACGVKRATGRGGRRGLGGGGESGERGEKKSMTRGATSGS